MFKLLKYIIILGIVGAIFLAFTDKKVGGKTVREHFDFITKSQTAKDMAKDVRVLVGESMKAVGEAISEDIPESDKKELENIIQKESGNN